MHAVTPIQRNRILLPEKGQTPRLSPLHSGPYLPLGCIFFTPLSRAFGALCLSFASRCLRSWFRALSLFFLGPRFLARNGLRVRLGGFPGLTIFLIIARRLCSGYLPLLGFPGLLLFLCSGRKDMLQP